MSRTSVTSTPRACAIPAQTPARTRSSALVVKERSGIRAHCTARVTRTWPTPTCASRTSTRLPVSRRRPSTLCPSSDSAEHVDLAELRVAAHLQGDVRRDDHVELADVDARLDVRLAGAEADVAEVERQVADAELVVCAEVLRAGDDVACGRRRRGRGGRGDGGEDRAPTSRSATSEPNAIAMPDEQRRMRRESSAASAARVRGRARPSAVAGDPEDRGARDQEQDPGVAVRPERRPREQDRARDGDERRGRSAARAGRGGCAAQP